MYTVNTKEKKFEIEFAPHSSTSGEMNGQRFELDLIQTGPNSLHLIKDHQSLIIDILETNYQTNEFTFKIKGCKYTVSVKDSISTLLEKLGMSQAPTQKMNQLKAPMPGLVVDVLVQVQQTVQPGDKLLLLEAMKMENNLLATASGTVKAIHCVKGQAVEKNQVLIEFE